MFCGWRLEYIPDILSVSLFNKPDPIERMCESINCEEEYDDEDEYDGKDYVRFTDHYTYVLTFLIAELRFP